MPQVEVLTASMAARTPRTAAMVHNHPYQRAVTPALPAPEYYGGSAPPAPSADVAPIHARLNSSPVRSARAPAI
jgi:hypothetical protein